MKKAGPLDRLFLCLGSTETKDWDANIKDYFCLD